MSITYFHFDYVALVIHHAKRMLLYTEVLISPWPDQEGKKLQRPKSNCCKPLKNNSESCPSNEVSAAAMTSGSDEKGRHAIFFSRVALRTYQHPCVLSSLAFPGLQIFSTLSHEYMIFGKKVLKYEMCVLILCNFVREFSDSKKNSARCCYKCICRSLTTTVLQFKMCDFSGETFKGFEVL